MHSLLSLLVVLTVGQTSVEMGFQARREAMAEDAKLNASYQALAKRLDAPTRALLVKAEQRWIAFRDAEVDFEADTYRGGSIVPTIRWSSYGRLTTSRIRMLAHAGPGRPDPGADKQLNVLYKELSGDRDPVGRKLLLKAQLAWLAYRDADAAFQAARYRAPLAGALTRLTEARSEELQLELNAGEEKP